MLIKKILVAIAVSLVIVACSNTKIVEPQPEPAQTTTSDESILQNK
jgi:hypothetical protein